MTAAQTIQIRLSECRQRLNTLLQIEMRSAKEQTEAGNVDGRSVSA